MVLFNLTNHEDKHELKHSNNNFLNKRYYVNLIRKIRHSHSFDSMNQRKYISLKILTAATKKKI